MKQGYCNLMGYELPYNILIKTAEKKEHLESFVAGNVFMHESGYFRPIDNKYRGDKYDSTMPVDASIHPLYIYKDGKKLEVPYLDTYNVGFEGDDKVPIFCASLLSNSIIANCENGDICFKQEFINEMLKFGKYALVFIEEEFVKNIRDYEKTHAGVCAITKNIKYADVFKDYPQLQDNEERNNIFRPFFIKDLSYAIQNEWRLLLYNENLDLIPRDKDYLILKLEPLTTGVIVEIEKLNERGFISLTKEESK